MTTTEEFFVQTAASITGARKQCEYTYRFSPGSYTHYALAAVQAAEKALNKLNEGSSGSA